jgi:hypothetical protein
MYDTFGTLLPEQKDALRPFVRGRKVTDLGAGSGGFSLDLLTMGASEVTAVDKEEMSLPPRKGLRAVRTYFSSFSDTIDVAFLSWPANRNDRDLNDLLASAPTVAYLGKNTDMVSCGSTGLFVGLLGRPILAYVPDRKNTLIVYGPKAESGPRLVRGEEAAGLLLYNPDTGEPWRYEEAEGTSPERLTEMVDKPGYRPKLRFAELEDGTVVCVSIQPVNEHESTLVLNGDRMRSLYENSTAADDARRLVEIRYRSRIVRWSADGPGKAHLPLKAT